MKEKAEDFNFYTPFWAKEESEPCECCGHPLTVEYNPVDYGMSCEIEKLVYCENPGCGEEEAA